MHTREMRNSVDEDDLVAYQPKVKEALPQTLLIGPRLTYQWANRTRYFQLDITDGSVIDSGQ